MVDAARQMLDELMGRNRNLHPSEAGCKVDWEDPDYCQFYNVKFCPHDLFINTRADLGPCTRIHDDEAKKLYEEARPSQTKREYEDEFLRFCNVMLHDVERKIQKGKQRLQLMQNDQPERAQTQSQASKCQEQINTINARIKKLLAEAEEAGIRGDVDQAQDLMTICEELKDEKETVQKQYENIIKLTTMTTRNSSTATATPPTSTSTTAAAAADLDWNGIQNNSNSRVNVASNNNADNTTEDAATSSSSPKSNAGISNETEDSMASDDNDRKSISNWSLSHDTNNTSTININNAAAVPEKQMKVCEICGAFLIVGDAQQRIEDHLMGKQHLGFSKLRNAVTEINDRRQKERDDDERRRREDRNQRGCVYNSSNRRDQREYRERSREYVSSSNKYQSSTSSSDKHRYHHKSSHHRNSHSRESRSNRSSHQYYRHESPDRVYSSRSRSRY